MKPTNFFETSIKARKFSNLEIGRLHPWHQSVNKTSKIIAISGVVRLAQIVNDVLANGQFFLGVCRRDMDCEIVHFLALGVFYVKSKAGC